MRVSRHSRQLLPGLLLGACGLVLAADHELPEAEFLEYLGSWEESDEEWLIFDIDSDALVADSDERIDPAPQGEESAEEDDED
jgi:hypothetical protein